MNYFIYDTLNRTIYLFLAWSSGRHISNATIQLGNSHCHSLSLCDQIPFHQRYNNYFRLTPHFLHRQKQSMISMHQKQVHVNQVILPSLQFAFVSTVSKFLPINTNQCQLAYDGLLNFTFSWRVPLLIFNFRTYIQFFNN